MIKNNTALSGFSTFGLQASLLRAVEDLGFTEPTAIQEQTIRPMLAGRDVLGQAQTGTGKTAAFALPLLNYLSVGERLPQLLVLTPTRELAIQVAEAFKQFARHMGGVSILPVYGGADIRGQIRSLKKGAQIIVGTPGRVMDLMRRNSLLLDGLTSIVLDEADEMLQMGFQEDVEWILEHAPEKRQMALFSATLPTAIRQIAKRFMNEPQEVTIRSTTSTAPTIHQRYWRVAGLHKLDALSRILEVEEYDGVIIFVRTRAATLELAENLTARGFSAAPLNGDIPQHMREQTVDRLKSGRIHLLVATDVAARGLDVDRISHVINYDMPHDPEAYIHRVGRTGRAGRKGEAILFVSTRDRGMLAQIEKKTRQKIEPLEFPTAAQINEKRIASFKQQIADEIESGNLETLRKIVYELQKERGLSAEDVAAAALRMARQDNPLLLSEKPVRVKQDVTQWRPEPDPPLRKGASRQRRSALLWQEYRVEVGHAHGAKAGNLLGAIVNETGLDGSHVGKIRIEKEFSTIDLPAGMPDAVLHSLKTVWVAGQQLNISVNANSTNRFKQRKKFSSRKFAKSKRPRRAR